jgi:cytochrome c oxidase subunit 4
MEQDHLHGEKHPGPGLYIKVAGILTVITLIEVLVFYLTLSPALMASMLLALSATKFAGVLAFFMHLKFDDRRYTLLFIAPFFLMIGILVALLALFQNLTR